MNWIRENFFQINIINDDGWTNRWMAGWKLVDDVTPRLIRQQHGAMRCALCIYFATICRHGKCAATSAYIWIILLLFLHTYLLIFHQIKRKFSNDQCRWMYCCIERERERRGAKSWELSDKWLCRRCRLFILDKVNT